MAKTNAVWGIDIGQCALKAMRCKLADDKESVEIDKYDYICLLYTSPSPRDRQKSRMPSSA